MKVKILRSHKDLISEEIIIYIFVHVLLNNLVQMESACMFSDGLCSLSNSIL